MELISLPEILNAQDSRRYEALLSLLPWTPGLVFLPSSLPASRVCLHHLCIPLPIDFSTSSVYIATLIHCSHSPHASFIIFLFIIGSLPMRVPPQLGAVLSFFSTIFQPLSVFLRYPWLNAAAAVHVVPSTLNNRLGSISSSWFSVSGSILSLSRWSWTF